MAAGSQYSDSGRPDNGGNPYHFTECDNAASGQPEFVGRVARSDFEVPV